jgi:Zn finger protein HypA/HybF involved in hydrogenase expression
MQNTSASILFRCPECHESFEFDPVEENEFIACPVCGTNCVTVKKGSKVALQAIEQLLC